MRYQLTPINTRPWLLDALSLRLIESHYENQYGGGSPEVERNHGAARLARLRQARIRAAEYVHVSARRDRSAILGAIALFARQGQTFFH